MKDKVWFLIPVMTAIIVIGTITFLYFQPQINQADDAATSSQDITVQYSDYLGQWVHGQTQFGEFNTEQPGWLIEIQEITDRSVQGTITKVLKKTAANSIIYGFSGHVKVKRAEIQYIDETSKRHRGIITLKGDKIGVRLDNDPIFKPTKREILFTRANIRVKTPSLKEVLNWLHWSRSEIVKKLGSDYKVLPSGMQGTHDGYFYPKRNVVIVFENTKKKDRVAWVDCKEAIDINGVKMGFLFDEIRSKLGNAPLTETWEGTPDHRVYRLEYFVPHAKIRFQSESKNGDYSKVFILNR